MALSLDGRTLEISKNKIGKGKIEQIKQNYEFK